MAVEIATAYVSLVPSAKGIVGNIAKELAPIETAAAATGSRAGIGLGSKLTQGIQSALPGATGPAGALFSTAGTLLGGALVVGFAAALVGIGQQFGQVRNQIIQETGQTGAALEGTFNAVKQVFADVPASLGQVTTAVDLLRQRGVPLGDTLNTLAKQEIDLARITKTDLGSNVEATTALFAKFQVGIKDQPAALDALFKASQLSGKGITDLLENLRSGGTSFQQFGFNLQQSAALIAGLEKAGINVGPVLAGMRRAFGQLAKAGQDPKKAFQDLIAEFKSGKDPVKATADAVKLFGARAGPELATALQRGNLNVDALLKTITDGKGGILDTAESTRTLADRLTILKNRAELALQPLASAVWKQVKQIFLDLEKPVGDLVAALGNLATAAAPLAAVFGGAIVGTLKLAGPVIEAFAQGLQTIADILGNIPTPVLIAAGAIGVLTGAFFALRSIGGVTGAAVGISEFLDALNPVQATLIVAAAAVTALGFAIELFGSQTSAAAKEAKDAAGFLNATGDAATLFKDNITNATDGWTQYLQQATAAGDVSKGLIDKLRGAGLSVKDLAGAVTGSAQDFETLKTTLFPIPDTLNDQARALANVAGKMSAADLITKLHDEDQANLVAKYAQSTKAIDDQRDAFVKYATGAIRAASATGRITPEQRKLVDNVTNTTGALGGLGKALDLTNEFIVENAQKTQAQALAAFQSGDAINQLKRDVLDGTKTIDDAASVASQFGISLDDAKKIIQDTGSELDKFVQQVAAGLPSANTAFDTFKRGIDDAFQGAADAADKGATAVAAAQGKLKVAMDPTTFINDLNAQTVAIAQFGQSLATIAGENLPALANFLAAKGIDAAPLAKAFASDKNKAKMAEASLELFGAVSDTVPQGVKENAAAYNVAGVGLGNALGTGIGTGATTSATAGLAGLSTTTSGAVQGVIGTFSANNTAVNTAASAMGASALFGYNKAIDPGFSNSTGAAIQTSIVTFNGQTPAMDKAARDMGAGALFGYDHVVATGLPSSAQGAAQGATGAINAQAGPHSAAAGSLGQGATDAYGNKLDPAAQSTAAFNQAATTISTLTDVQFEAGQLGGDAGAAFGNAMGNAIFSKIPFVAAQADALAGAAIAAANKKFARSSPSKVGIAIGTDFAVGMAVGIDSGKPTVTTSSQQLAGAAIDAIAGTKAPTVVIPLTATTGPAAAHVTTRQTFGAAPTAVHATINSLDPATGIQLLRKMLRQIETRNGFVNVRAAKA